MAHMDQAPHISSDELPLRPGERLEREFYEKHAMVWFFLVGVSSALTSAAGMAWIQVFSRPGWLVWELTGASLIAVTFTAVRMRGGARRACRLLLGVRGEREVGLVLDELRADGYLPFHGVRVPARDRYPEREVDHVLIGPAGVFAIETKRRSTVDGKGTPLAPRRVEHRGRSVTVDGFSPDRDPLAQARASAAAVGAWLRERTGIEAWARAVVLFPKASVRTQSGADEWVLEPSQLTAWLGQEERWLARRGRPLLQKRQLESLAVALEALSAE